MRSSLRRPALRSGLRPAAVAVAGLLLVGGAAGCSSGSSSSSSSSTATSSMTASASSSASESASGAASSSTSMTASTDASGSATDASSAAAVAEAVSKAVAQKKSASFTLDMTAAGQKISAKGQMRFEPGNLGMAMTMDLPGSSEKLEMVLLKDALYVKLPAGQEPIKGKPWLKVSAGGSDPVSQQLAPMFAQLQKSVDPSSSLDVIRHGTTITSRAQDTVDGQKATKYVFSVDVSKAAANATGTAKSSLEQLVQQGVKTMHYTLWVSDQNLPLKFTITQKTPQGQVDMTGTYSKWGEPVSIAAPPKSQTFSASDVPTDSPS